MLYLKASTFSVADQMVVCAATVLAPSSKATTTKRGRNKEEETETPGPGKAAPTVFRGGVEKYRVKLS